MALLTLANLHSQMESIEITDCFSKDRKYRLEMTDVSWGYILDNQGKITTTTNPVTHKTEIGLIWLTSHGVINIIIIFKSSIHTVFRIKIM